MDTTKKYLNFPVPLIWGLFHNKDHFFYNILAVGPYYIMDRFEGSEKERYSLAMNFLGVSFHNYLQMKDRAFGLLHELHPHLPITGIDRDMLFDYGQNQKTEFEIACLGAFLGIKSILGTKPYCKTNKALIHARMFGYASVKELPQELRPIEKKYQSRWFMDAVLIELQMNWSVKIVSNHKRGMLISFDLDFKDLALVQINSEKQNKIQQFKEMKRNAIQEAKNQSINK